MAFVTVLRFPSVDNDELDEERVEDLTVRQRTLIPSLKEMLNSRIEIARDTLGEEAADNERNTQIIVLLGRVMDLTRDFDDDDIPDIWQAAFFVGKCYHDLDEHPPLLPSNRKVCEDAERAISNVLSEDEEAPPISALN